ncbi:MAG: anhydro-N-acetylmuramic acid kinase [Rhodobacterales bacterium]|nr:MAG: anhydro-N-acetylmuramic acid kinase [Rhodobacterales bacterium]
MLTTDPVWALGAMSGTSLDGVDAAMLHTDGERILAFGDSAYQPYTPDERALIAAAFGQWPGGPGVEAAAELVETAHARLLSRFEDVDLVGFHGQTLAHDPANQRTHQAGDGRVLAEVLQRPVVWDFRSADVEMGGQGAPLAPFFHFACAKWAGETAPLAFLNLGGVGNLTWIDPCKSCPEDAGALLAFDTGPANAPINDLLMARRGLSCDQDGALAAVGDVDEALIEAFLQRGYFHKIPPKSLDRNDFPDLLGLVAAHEDAAAAATLTALAAACVAKGFEHCPQPPGKLLVCGGGRKNPVLMAMLAALLECPVGPVEQLGLDGDMLEAQAFAYLAVRVLRGLPTSAPSTTGVAAAVGGGTLSRPGEVIS